MRNNMEKKLTKQGVNKMKTYIIKNPKDIEKFKDKFGYNVDGNLEISCSLDLKGRLLADGYISAGGFIKAGEYIKADGYIKAGGFIKSGGFIKAGAFINSGEYISACKSINSGGYIEAGDYYGIQAGLFITCKGILKYGLKCFAGICTWREITDSENIITCGKHEGGVIKHGILNETGIDTEQSLSEKIVKAELYSKTYTTTIN